MAILDLRSFGRFLRLAALLALTIFVQAAFAQADPDYLLGPDDVVTVTVLKHPEFSGDFLIPASGLIEVPGVGTVKAAGLGLNAISDHLRNRLRVRLKKPEVTVSLKVPRIQRFSLLGNVEHPGTLDFQRGWRLTEGLGAAGGLVPGVRPDDTRIIILRSTGERITVPYADAVADRNGKNIPIQPGDVITVETIEAMSIYVVGKVRNPAMYKLRPGETGPVEAILAAGGVSEGAATNAVKIVHTDGTEEVANLTPVLEKGIATTLPRLRNGDLVVVPESTSRIAILGAVAKPSYFAIPEDQPLTLIEALARADGADPQKGRLSRVALVRTVNGKEQRKVYDVGRYLRTGDKRQNPLVQNGDVIYVPPTDRVEWTTILSSISTAALLFRVFQR